MSMVEIADLIENGTRNLVEEKGLECGEFGLGVGENLYFRVRTMELLDFGGSRGYPPCLLDPDAESGVS